MIFVFLFYAAVVKFSFPFRDNTSFCGVVCILRSALMGTYLDNWKQFINASPCARYQATDDRLPQIQTMTHPTTFTSTHRCTIYEGMTGKE